MPGPGLRQSGRYRSLGLTICVAAQTEPGLRPEVVGDRRAGFAQSADARVLRRRTTASTKCGAFRSDPLLRRCAPPPVVRGFGSRSGAGRGDRGRGIAGAVIATPPPLTGAACAW